MSQEYFPRQESSAGRRGTPSPSRNTPSRPPSTSEQMPRTPGRPNYMTVGAGSTSASAAALTAMLDHDSGYGTMDRSTPARGWIPAVTEDRPTPSHTPVLPGESNPESENERRVLASHIHQLYYNQNRVSLGRAINRTVDTLKDLQEMNTNWPAHYPSVQRPETTAAPQRSDPRPGLVHTQSTTANFDRSAPSPAPPRPGGLKRAFTSGGEESSQAESSTAAEGRPAPEPRLITPQIAQEFSILKIDLKLGALSQSELVHSLEKHSIASLLDGKISESVRHLLALRDRIEDTSSKVLVTGDLNAGKSTFCNALLRRKILPEDQQPCTSIFCEVLDARENAGIEEVHAVHKETQYNRHDESTYDVYRLLDLEKIVVDNDHYTQAKVYVKDVRSIDESLLNNGVVDISIIDAPGLNLDSLKTTAVFARQEEIDVVVFVVSAANHFTLSAKEFIWNAAREKAYIFIVVNGFDNIRDKERCQKMILEQVANLSPRTFKESAELVHFVSSNAIPVAPPSIGGGSDGGSGGGGGDGGGSSSGPNDFPQPDEDDEDEPKGKHGEKGEVARKNKGKEKEKMRDFETLEQALRRFVLEKRARSKLAPAKTYLLNVLGDIHNLATVNRDVAQAELDRVKKELEELEPVFEQSKKARSEVSEDIDRTIEDTCSEVYDHTRSRLSSTIGRVAEDDLGVAFPGIWNAFQYAEDVKTAMLSQITCAVLSCETHARDLTEQGVSSIKDLAHLHLGDESNEVDSLSFHRDTMFARKRDTLARQVGNVDVEMWDFFDVSGMMMGLGLGKKGDTGHAVAGTGMAMTVVGLLGGRMVGGIGWLDGALGAFKIIGSKGIRRLIVPGIFVAVIASTTTLLLSLPHTLPHRLSSKLSNALAEQDYIHTNSSRLSTQVRKILRTPADTLRVGLQRSVESLMQQRGEREGVKRESETARKYFGNLVREAGGIRTGVEGVDLEGPAPGVAGGYDY
ncbi:MAG: mitofusin [Caeruleum heppii]|nr:MAG: mitofusin [Caeruleum heppii]